MDGLALSLSMEHDPIGAAAFIVERLSWHGDNEEVAVTVAGPIAISDVDTATYWATCMVALMLFNNIALYLHL